MRHADATGGLLNLSTKVCGTVPTLPCLLDVLRSKYNSPVGDLRLTWYSISTVVHRPTPLPHVNEPKRQSVPVIVPIFEYTIHIAHLGVSDLSAQVIVIY